MYRMILVDDEPQIRRGLEGLIPWEDYGIELVGEADNGVSAKILIERVCPDIAIVDIRMPQMDGLQLLAQAKELTSCPKFIMLSGFDQFDYVRTAMRLGAKNYLLKPVDPEELKAAVIDVASALDEEAQKKQQFEQSLQALMNHTLNRMLCNQIEVRELREKCRLLGITLRCNHMLVGIVRPFFDNQDVSLRWITFRCMDICRERMNRYLTVYPAADAADNIVLIIKNPELAFQREQMLRFLQECADTIQREIGISSAAVLGTDAASFKELPASYQNALRMLDIKCIWGDVQIEPDTVVSMQQTVGLTFEPELMTNMLLQNEQETLKQMIRRFFRKTLKENHVTSLVMVKYHLIELVTCALQAAHKCCIPATELEQLRTSSYAAIQSCTSIHALEHEMQDLMQRLCDRVQYVDTSGYSPKVQAVVQYVHQQYNDSNLSLKTLADKLAVNSAYLGRTFNLETGVFFSDYLNEIRIRHAKELLNTTSLKLAEVAEQVGFVNVSYFSTIYKNITGERPGQSRTRNP